VHGVKWILALDEHCGPVLPLITYRNGRPLVSIPSTASSMNDIKWNQDYYSLRHMSAFVHGGGNVQRVSSQKNYNDNNNIQAEAFYNTHNGLMTVVVMNNDHWNSQSLYFASNNYAIQFMDTLPPFATKIYQWTQ
jgi:hypothetical protein